MWPRTSMRVEFVCCAMFCARVLVFSFFRAVFRIRIFIISCVSSCLSISLFICGVVPSLPIQIVGFSVASSCFILRFVLAVVMFVFSPVFYWEPHVSAAVEACYDYVWFSVLFDAYAAVDAWLNEFFAMFADLSFVLCW